MDNAVDINRDLIPHSIAEYERLSAADIQPLTRINDMESALSIAVDLVCIGGVIAVVKLVASYWLYPLAIMVIGARQQGMIVLMHEASHRKLFRNPRVNDFVGDVLLAWPFFISMFSYRANHFAHHRHMNTEFDPDWIRYFGPNAEQRIHWTYNRSWFQVLRPLVTDLVGLGAALQLKRVLRLSKPRNHNPLVQSAEADRAAEERFRGYPTAFKVSVYGLLAAGLTVTGSWSLFFLLWLVPAATMLKMCLRLRLLSGHFAIYGGEGVRTVKSSRLGRFLLSPHAIGYHSEHHLYPAVFFRRLPELHERLVARGDYDGQYHIRKSHGHFQMLADWTRDLAAQRATLTPSCCATGQDS